MKILHTSDWHVDLHAAQLGEASAVVRGARWRAIERLVKLAEQSAVELVLVAGDTFDSVDADDETVARVVTLLNAFSPTPVVVISGNHDPMVAGGVWDRPGWEALEDHVVLAMSEEEIELDLPSASQGLVVYPRSIHQKRSRLDPTADIPAREPTDRRLRVGLAHGSLDVVSKADNFPIARDRAAECGLDYLALGDWHGQRVFADGTTAYCGTPETASFAEQRSGFALLVELDPKRSSAPGIEPVRVGQYSWLQREAELRDATDLAELEADLLALGPPERAVVRLSVRLVQDESEDEPAERQANLLGASAISHQSGSWIATVEEFRRKWQDRLLFLEWSLDELVLGTGDLPVALAEIDEVLRRLMGNGEIDHVLDDLRTEDPTVIREARWQLRMLATEAAG